MTLEDRVRAALGTVYDPEYSDYPRLTTEGKKKILGLNAARLYGIDVPAEALPVADGARLVEEAA